MYDNSHLGQRSAYPKHYDPSLLHPIPRAPQRQSFADYLAPYGQDIWTHYEVSWLNAQGLPQVAMARCLFPASSTYLLESKSLKLYFNSLNQTPFASSALLQSTLQTDLSQKAEAPVDIRLYLPEAWSQYPLSAPPAQAQCLDSLSPHHLTFHTINPELLAWASPAAIRQECLYTHLFASRCPVTEQPDWATLFVDYEGPAIEHTHLLHYLLSFRCHLGFHEQCVERIFADLKKYMKCHSLTVYACFNRRGGLDINPYRSDIPPAKPLDHWQRLWRQ